MEDTTQLLDLLPAVGSEGIGPLKALAATGRQALYPGGTIYIFFKTGLLV